MPIKECQLDGKSGYKWGDSGKCYVHNNTPASKKRAKKQALEQGIAIGDFENKDNYDKGTGKTA